jgi:hypothetical protein
MIGENIETTDLSEGISHLSSIHSRSQVLENQAAMEAQLQKDLTDAQKNGWMPIIISVNADNEPLVEVAKGKNGYKDLGSGRAHAVVITGCEAGPPARVHVINPQGENVQFGSADGISVHDLYLSMLPRKQVIIALESDIKKEANDPALENDVYLKRLNLLRLQIEEGQINRAQARVQFERLEAESNRLALSDQDWQRVYLLASSLQAYCEGHSNQIQ